MLTGCLSLDFTYARSALADANENRDWRIYADFAQVLISIARKLYRDEDFGVELKETVYALDSTTIDLCLSLFPWARFRKHKGAVKMHTLLDLRGNIPSLIWITYLQNPATLSKAVISIISCYYLAYNRTVVV